MLYAQHVCHQWKILTVYFVFLQAKAFVADPSAFAAALPAAPSESKEEETKPPEPEKEESEESDDDLGIGSIF